MIINLPTPGYKHERILTNQFNATDYALAEFDKKINKIIEEFEDGQKVNNKRAN